MTSCTWNIRPAAIHDARAIAEVHVESYRSAYRGIFSDALIDGLSTEARESSWRHLLEDHQRPPGLTLIGCDSVGGVAGFASGGKERTGKLGCDGELYAIYLLPGAQRKGLGTLLVREFARGLISHGFGSMAVWVLALNPARKFYDDAGGMVIGEQPIERGGQRFMEVAYGWQNLDVLSLIAVRGDL